MLGAILSWIIVGLIVGLIARAVVPGSQPMGIVGTVCLGIGGAILGGIVSWLFSGVPQEYTTANAWPGWILSLFGAIILLLLLYKTKRRL